MTRDDKPALGQLESYAALLAEHGLFVPPIVIGCAWYEWQRFIECRRAIVHGRTQPPIPLDQLRRK